jgi:beta-phosphoglucomutase family hydrolase
VAPRLPPQIKACLFDLDGVVTQTAAVHAAAWKQMFDEFLSGWSAQHSAPFQPFDIVDDYDNYIDGRPRADGTRAFLKARGIALPDGQPDDPPDALTIDGLSNRKNQLLLKRLTDDGVRVYQGSVRFIEQVRQAGMSTAVVSSSANTERVLAAAGIASLFDVRVDAEVAAQRQLAGKPAPDTYLAAADMLHVPPAQAAVFEDALAGVEAGRAGHFGLVVGVDRVHQADALKDHGADVVVDDLDELIG